MVRCLPRRGKEPGGATSVPRLPQFSCGRRECSSNYAASNREGEERKPKVMVILLYSRRILVSEVPE
jgi:hypothetical protein